MLQLGPLNVSWNDMGGITAVRMEEPDNNAKPM